MKKVVGLIALAACVVLAGAPAVAAGIASSAHDFSGAAWNTSGEICIVCHAPHNPNPGDKPLWNHTITGETFTMYGTTTAGTATDSTPNPQTKLCLSCHDGVTKIDAFGGAAGTITITNPATSSVETDLTDDHPVSITYDTGNDLKTAPSTLPLYSNKVECATCHDVHNGGTGSKLLRVANTTSALCLSCHDK